MGVVLNYQINSHFFERDMILDKKTVVVAMLIEISIIEPGKWDTL